MTLNYYTVKVYDRDNQMLYSSDKTGFNEEEVIREVALRYKDKWADGVGRDSTKLKYPLTFKCSIRKEE